MGRTKGSHKAQAAAPRAVTLVHVAKRENDQEHRRERNAAADEQ